MRKKKRGNKYKNINKISKEEDKEGSFALNHIKKQDQGEVMDKVITF